MSSIQLDANLETLNIDSDVDVEAVLARIRERVGTNQSSPLSSLLPVPQPVCKPDQAQSSMQAQADFNRAVVESLSHIGQLIVSIRNGLEAFAQIERDYSNHRTETASGLDRVSRGLEGIGARVDEIAALASALRDHIGRLELHNGQDQHTKKMDEELHQQIEFLFNYVATVEKELDQKTETRWRSKFQVVAARAAALEESSRAQLEELRQGLKLDLANALEQFGFAARHNARRMQAAIKKMEQTAAKIESVDARSSLASRFDLRQELAQQMGEVKTRLQNVETSRTSLQVVRGETTSANSAQATGKCLESLDYFEFAQSFRGTRADIRNRQLAYLPLFLERKNVIDLGCGRGEFVEVLSDKAVHVTGVERNQRMFDYCRGRNLNVVQADLFDFLESLPDASLDGVFAAQVVEHLSPEENLRLIDLWKKKLQPSGIVVAETINPHCAYALGNFCLDPTHVRPVPPRLLTFMFEQSSLRLHSLKFSSPVPGSNAVAFLDLIADSPEQTGLYQDYAAIGIRI
jgi:2-polyprenyl-3-methyl-5-hydroxy-6-metoxy-1,4-benzoquinol methylase